MQWESNYRLFLKSNEIIMYVCMYTTLINQPTNSTRPPYQYVGQNGMEKASFARHMSLIFYENSAEVFFAPSQHWSLAAHMKSARVVLVRPFRPPCLERMRYAASAQ